MARTVECRDLGVDCDYSVIDEADRDEFIMDEMLKHAHMAHQDIIKDVPDIGGEIRKHIKNLAQQSHYTDQANQE